MMNRVVKISLLLTTVFYIAGSLGAASLNPFAWESSTRHIVASFWTFCIVMIICIAVIQSHLNNNKQD
jgi:hypothetical protein